MFLVTEMLSTCGLIVDQVLCAALLNFIDWLGGARLRSTLNAVCTLHSFRLDLLMSILSIPWRWRKTNQQRWPQDSLPLFRWITFVTNYR